MKGCAWALFKALGIGTATWAGGGTAVATEPEASHDAVDWSEHISEAQSRVHALPHPPRANAQPPALAASVTPVRARPWQTVSVTVTAQWPVDEGLRIGRVDCRREGHEILFDVFFTMWDRIRSGMARPGRHLLNSYRLTQCLPRLKPGRYTTRVNVHGRQGAMAPIAPASFTVDRCPWRFALLRYLITWR